MFDHFSAKPSVVWKEEDLQSYMYHRILDIDPSMKNRVHREYPVVRGYQPRDWAGMLDVAVTEKNERNFRLEDVTVTHAIELKFMRHWRTGVSPKSLVGFEKECNKDAKKLNTKAVNFQDDAKKYFIALRLTTIRQIDDVGRIFESIEWDDIEYSYLECLTNGDHCEIISIAE